jgi:hypothetical protein
VGTDGGVYGSRDQGATWESLCGDLPTTPVEDLEVHPQARQILIATHGRGVFLLDEHPIEELTAEIVASPLHIFQARPVTLEFHAPLEVNPRAPGRADLYFWTPTAQPVRISAVNAAGATVRTLETNSVPGVNQIGWDLRSDSGRPIPAGVYRIQISAGTAQDATELVIHPVGR